MKIILYQPDIPQNAGNIVRTCSVTGSDLIFVRPLGFSVQDRWLKRAGLDYWENVNVSFIDDLEEYLTKCQDPFYFLSSKSDTLYTDAAYTNNAILIFGSETKGLPERFKTLWPDRFLKIPMQPNARCLNLATSVGIVLYEGLRQCGFESGL